MWIMVCTIIFQLYLLVQLLDIFFIVRKIWKDGCRGHAIGTTVRDVFASFGLCHSAWHGISFILYMFARLQGSKCFAFYRRMTFN